MVGELIHVRSKIPSSVQVKQVKSLNIRYSDLDKTWDGIEKKYDYLKSNLTCKEMLKIYSEYVIPRRFEVIDKAFNKYLKYKNKYIELKNKINNKL